MFNNIGFPELMVLLVVVLLLFGARRLPEIGASLGKGIREFKRSFTEVSDSVNTMPPPPDNRGQPERQLDAADRSAAPTTGDPKRLSQ